MLRKSPLTHTDKIKTPLMVVRGANDPRANKSESDQIVIALRDRNYPVEYLVADDEGHGFARPVNNLAMIAAAEKFLSEHLGGRYQETVSPDVAKRRMEKVTVPAGTFDAYKVESILSANDADKTTIWISKDRKVLKTQSVLLQMGGAVMTVERQ